MRQYGNPASAEYWQQSLGEICGVLESLCDRECEYMEEMGYKTYGDGLMNVRLDIVEKARELLQVADDGDPKIMRKVRLEFKNQKCPRRKQPNREETI